MENQQQTASLKQYIKDNVYCNDNLLIDILMENSLLSILDVENIAYYILPNGNECDFEEIQHLIRDCENEIFDIEHQDVLTEEDEEKIEELYELIDALQKLEPEYREIFEYYRVSENMIRELKKRNYPHISNNLGNWMCRTTTGQPLYMDGIIHDIVFQ